MMRSTTLFSGSSPSTRWVAADVSRSRAKERSSGRLDQSPGRDGVFPWNPPSRLADEVGREAGQLSFTFSACADRSPGEGARRIGKLPLTTMNCRGFVRPKSTTCTPNTIATTIATTQFVGGAGEPGDRREQRNIKSGSSRKNSSCSLLHHKWLGLTGLCLALLCAFSMPGTLALPRFFLPRVLGRGAAVTQKYMSVTGGDPWQLQSGEKTIFHSHRSESGVRPREFATLSTRKNLEIGRKHQFAEQLRKLQDEARRGKLGFTGSTRGAGGEDDDSPSVDGRHIVGHGIDLRKSLRHPVAEHLQRSYTDVLTPPVAAPWQTGRPTTTVGREDIEFPENSGMMDEKAISSMEESEVASEKAGDESGDETEGEGVEQRLVFPGETPEEKARRREWEKKMDPVKVKLMAALEAEPDVLRKLAFIAHFDSDARRRLAKFILALNVESPTDATFSSETLREGIVDDVVTQAARDPALAGKMLQIASGKHPEAFGKVMDYLRGMQTRMQPGWQPDDSA